MSSDIKDEIRDAVAMLVLGMRSHYSRMAPMKDHSSRVSTIPKTNMATTKQLRYEVRRY